MPTKTSAVFRDITVLNVIFLNVNGGAKSWKLGKNKDLTFEGSTQNE